MKIGVSTDVWSVFFKENGDYKSDYGDQVAEVHAK